MINLSDNRLNNNIELEQKIWLKQLLTHVEYITLIGKLNLKLQC